MSSGSPVFVLFFRSVCSSAGIHRCHWILQWLESAVCEARPGVASPGTLPMVKHTGATFSARIDVRCAEQVLTYSWRGARPSARSVSRLYRFTGTLLGLYCVPAVLWYYWPEAQAYVASWPAVALCLICLLLDLAYPVCLWRVRRSEVVLPDGRIVSAREARAASKTD